MSTEPPVDVPFRRHRDAVRPEWIDFNGHMNLAYYVLVFDGGTDALFGHLGLDDAYRRRFACSLFAVEQHVVYRAEVTAGTGLEIESLVLGFDAKRLHFFHRMHDLDRGRLAATAEIMAVNVDMNTRRAAPFPAEAVPRMARVVAAHAALPRPPEVGRSVRAV